MSCSSQSNVSAALSCISDAPIKNVWKSPTALLRGYSMALHGRDRLAFHPSQPVHAVRRSAAAAFYPKRPHRVHMLLAVDVSWHQKSHKTYPYLLAWGVCNAQQHLQRDGCWSCRTFQSTPSGTSACLPAVCLRSQHLRPSLRLINCDLLLPCLRKDHLTRCYLHP